MASSAAKPSRVGRDGAAALLLIALAGGIRLALITSGWPHLNADEGTMGLMARHIAYRGDHPIFFYGQAYMGTIEAYLGAVVFRVLGSSTVALRLGPLVLFCAFLAVLYLLAKQLYDRRVALLSLGLLSLGSDAMLFHQVQAIGGYTETLLFAALLFAVASWLSLNAHGPRSLAFLGWGLASGLGLWSDLLIVPFIVASGGLLLAFCRHDLRTRPGLFLLGGLLLGASPLMAFEVGTAGSQTILSTFVTTYRAGQGGSAPSLLRSAAATLVVSLPVMTGGTALCPLSPAATWPLGPQAARAVVRCTIMHGVWGSGVGLLWMLAVVRSGRAWWSAWRCPARGEDVAVVLHARALQSARLALLGAAGLTVLFYTLSPAAAQSPWFNARYLIGIWLALPAILAPLTPVQRGWHAPSGGRGPAASLAVLALLCTTLIAGTVETFAQVPATQQLDRWQQGFIQQVLQRRITHLYTDYWTCDRVAFQSDERLVCSVLDERLRPGLNRYLPYQAIVRSDPGAAYAFPDGSKQLAVLARQARQGDRYRHFPVNGYIIYQPEHISADAWDDREAAADQDGVAFFTAL